MTELDRLEKLCHFTTIFLIVICNAFSWDTVEYGTRHLFFPYTLEHLGESVYEEYTLSGIFHDIPRESTP